MKMEMEEDFNHWRLWRKRQIELETDRDRGTETERQRHRKREMDRQFDSQKLTHRQTDRKAGQL